MKRFYSLLVCCTLGLNILLGQNSSRIWTKSFSHNTFDLSELNTKEKPTSNAFFNLNIDLLYEKLKEAPIRNSYNKRSNVILSFPNAKGHFENFQIFETQSLGEQLQIQFPNIKSFVG